MDISNQSGHSANLHSETAALALSLSLALFSSAQPHSVPGLFDELEEGGPNVAIITAQTNGYSAELERTFFLGAVPDEAKKALPNNKWDGSGGYSNVA